MDFQYGDCRPSWILSKYFFPPDRFYCVAIYNLSKFGANILSLGEDTAENWKFNMAAVIYWIYFRLTF